MENREKIQFVKNLSECYHQYGLPSHRLENKMETFCKLIKLPADFFVSLSSIFIYFDNKGQHETHLIKIRNSELNINKMDRLDQLLYDVQNKKTTAKEGLLKLEEIKSEKLYDNFLFFILFFALSTGSAASLFGGNLADISCSFIIGAFIGLLIHLIQYYPPFSKILFVVASIMSVCIASIFNAAFYPFHSEISVLCGLIILIPGFSFTVSINELVNAHFISGMSRLSYTLVSLIMIAVGIWIGTFCVDYFNLTFESKTTPVHPSWIKYLALFLIPLGFIVLFKAKWKDLIWFTLACWISYFVLQFVSNRFNPAFGMFLTSFCLAISSRIFYLIFKRSDSIILIPGLILLVPGSLGFQSVIKIFDNQLEQGFHSAITMFGISLSIVFGIVLSNILIPTTNKSNNNA